MSSKHKCSCEALFQCFRWLQIHVHVSSVWRYSNTTSPQTPIDWICYLESRKKGRTTRLKYNSATSVLYQVQSTHLIVVELSLFSLGNPFNCVFQCFSSKFKQFSSMKSSKVCPTKTKALPETKKNKGSKVCTDYGQNTWRSPSRKGKDSFRAYIFTNTRELCHLLFTLGVTAFKPPRNMRLRTGWLCLLGIALLGESTSQEVKSEEEPRLAQMHGLWKASCEGLGQNIGLVSDRLPSSKPTNIFLFHLKVA